MPASPLPCETLFSVGQCSAPARPLSDLKPKESCILLPAGPLNPLGMVGKELRGAAQMDLISLARNPECRYLASASKDGSIRIWDTLMGRCDKILTSHTQSVTCVKWGGDGLLYSSSQDRTIKVWRSQDVSGGLPLGCWQRGLGTLWGSFVCSSWHSLCPEKQSCCIFLTCCLTPFARGSCCVMFLSLRALNGAKSWKHPWSNLS